MLAQSQIEFNKFIIQSCNTICITSSHQVSLQSNFHQIFIIKYYLKIYQLQQASNKIVMSRTHLNRNRINNLQTTQIIQDQDILNLQQEYNRNQVGDREHQNPQNIQNQKKNGKKDSVKKLTKIYKTLVQKSQLRFFKTRGLCLIIKPNRIRPYLVQIIPYQMFKNLYIRNFKSSYKQLSDRQVISQIMILLVKAKQFVGRNHFNSGQKCAMSLAAHASWVYKPFKKTTSKDYRVRIPGTTGLLKVIFRKIFEQHLKTDQKLQNIFNEKYRKNFKSKHNADKQLGEKIKDQLQKIIPPTFKKGDNKQKKMKRIRRYLRKIDKKSHINPRLVNWAIQNFKQNTYSVSLYQFQQSLEHPQEPEGPYKSQITKQNEYIDEMRSQREKRLRKEKRQKNKLISINNLEIQNERQSFEQVNQEEQEDISLENDHENESQSQDKQKDQQVIQLGLRRSSNSSRQAFYKNLRTIKSWKSNQNEMVLDKIFSKNSHNFFEVMSNEQYYFKLQKFEQQNKKQYLLKSEEYWTKNYFLNQDIKLTSPNLFHTWSMQSSYQTIQENNQDNFSLQRNNSNSEDSFDKFRNQKKKK